MEFTYMIFKSYIKYVLLLATFLFIIAFGILAFYYGYLVETYTNILETILGVY